MLDYILGFVYGGLALLVISPLQPKYQWVCGFLLTLGFPWSTQPGLLGAVGVCMLISGMVLMQIAKYKHWKWTKQQE